MPITNLNAGTWIYLKKKSGHELYIQPGNVLCNDSLYVAYDVKCRGHVVIPKNTRVIGNWITEDDPIAAQLQVTRIYLHGSGQQLCADSDIIQATDIINDDSCHIREVHDYKSLSGITRKLTNNTNEGEQTLFITIFTKEIAVMLIQDFIPYPCLKQTL